MKLFLLKLDKDRHGYETALAYVIRARDETEARLFALSEGGADWYSPHVTTCEELTPEGEMGVIICDYWEG
jgi:hypothetical protein